MKGYTKDKFTGQQQLKSLIKIIGGKTRLRDQIYLSMPKQYVKFYEPFAGSLTVLIGKDKTGFEIAGDIYPYNVNFFNCLKFYPYELFDSIQLKLKLLEKLGKEYFLELRDLLNSDFDYNKDGPNLSQASTYYIINKSCTNGIVRFNLKGKCNSSYCGTAEGRGWLTEEWMLEVHNRLKDVLILQIDYRELLLEANEDDFVYLDPPYYEVWTSYGRGRFSSGDHLKLFEVLKNSSYKWLLSINDHPDIRILYKDFIINEVQTIWCCSQTPSGRGKKQELFISNYAT